MQKLKRWYARNFLILSVKQAQELGLTYEENLYGDSINLFNCRSLWVDEKDNFYRVNRLYLA